jgi:hypothetical protein
MTSEKEVEHMELPWSVKPDGCIRKGNGHCLPIASPWVEEAFNYDKEAIANAAFIVRAVNSHGALVRALEEMVYETTCLSPCEDDGSHLCRITGPALAHARAALSLAKGEK